MKIKRLTGLITVIAGLMLFAAGCAFNGNSGSQTIHPNKKPTAYPTATQAATNTPAPTNAEVKKPTATPAPVRDNIEVSDYSRRYLEKTEDETQIPSIFIYTAALKPVTSITEYMDCLVYTINDDSEFKHAGTPATIRVRGNSTAYYGDVQQILANQVPYRIKFDSKDNLFGLHDGLERKSWVLLKGNWNLLMDETGFSLGRTLFHSDNYCSDSMLVKVYVNNSDKGVYCLCEQSQTGKGRVDINEPAEGYTGTDIGYFFEIDNYNEQPSFNVNYANAAFTDINGVTRKFTSADYSIKSDIYSDAQKNFIKTYMNNLFTILLRASEENKYYTLDENNAIVDAPAELQSMEKLADRWLDMNSVVDTYILHEIVCSHDIGEGSFFMCVDFSDCENKGQLRFTSPWDFNWGYDVETGYYAGAFCSADFMKQYGDRSHPWFILFAKQDWFMSRVKQRLAEVGTDKLLGIVRKKRMLLNLFYEDLKVPEEWRIGSANDLLNTVEKRINWIADTYK